MKFGDLYKTNPSGKKQVATTGGQDVEEEVVIGLFFGFFKVRPQGVGNLLPGGLEKHRIFDWSLVKLKSTTFKYWRLQENISYCLDFESRLPINMRPSISRQHLHWCGTLTGH
ncbi:uncharacterized protein [Palaemon carinicauda]|uniref:uncharacterized protein n=1 Tax=Palaemon carinicauda TaxID=392227 RepID=UPI0035B5F36C